jgi:integrase
MGRKPSRNKNLPHGMRARHRKSGTYYYLDTCGTPRREIALGSDYALAVKKWAELTIHAQPRQTEFMTFRYAAERYQREILPQKAPQTQRANLRELTKLYEFFDAPPAPLAKIEPIHIRQYLDWRKSAPVGANREKALFSHIWNKAREWGFTDRPNPCIGVRGYSETGRKDVYVEDIIFRAVWDKADLPTRDAMDLAYLTGQRPADTLKFDERDIREGALWLAQNKTGKKLRITVQGDLAVVIDRIRARKRRYKVISTTLIVNEKGERLTAEALRFRFDAARKAAGIPRENFQFRDLRAKAGTDKEEREGMAAARDQLGHTDEKMTQRYVRHRKGKLVTPTR